MIKNLLGKAKSVLDEVESTLKSPDSTESKHFNYDETYFSFSVTGGPIHTELITASAKVRQGERAGNNVPLNCKWFFTKEENVLAEIKGVTGTSYQPCIDDVGQKIMIRALPAVPGMYLGKPIFQAVGPLKLDPEIQERAMKNLGQDQCELKVKIEALSFEPEDSSDMELPQEGFIVLNKEKQTIEVVYKDPEEEEARTIASCTYSESYPLVEIIRKSYSSFELHLSPKQIFKLSCKNHFERDTYAVTIRMFFTSSSENESAPPVHAAEGEAKDYQSIFSPEKPPEGENPFEGAAGGASEGGEAQEISRERPPAIQKPQAFSQGQSPADPQGSKFEDIMRIEQLTKKLRQAEKDKNELKEALALERASVEKMNGEIQELNNTVDKLTDENKEKDEKIKQVTEEKETIAAERLFFAQEISLYKNQINDLENALKASEKTKKLQSIEIENLTENKGLDFEKSEETVKELHIKISELELHKEQLQTENKNLTDKLQGGQVEKEELQATINSLKKRIQSLVQENTKRGGQKEASTPQPSTQSGFWNFPLSPLFGKQQSQPESRSMEIFDSKGNSLKDIDEYLKLKEQVKAQEEELRHQRETNLKLTKTIDTLKMTQDEAKGAKKGLLGMVLGEAGKQNAQDTEFMQKIVNTLTETIAEKDFMIEQTKQVNKELGKKINELEAKLKEEGKDKVLRVKC